MASNEYDKLKEMYRLQGQEERRLRSMLGYPEPEGQPLEDDTTQESVVAAPKPPASTVSGRQTGLASRIKDVPIAKAAPLPKDRDRYFDLDSRRRLALRQLMTSSSEYVAPEPEGLFGGLAPDPRMQAELAEDKARVSVATQRALQDVSDKEQRRLGDALAAEKLRGAAKVVPPPGGGSREPLIYLDPRR